MLAILGTAVNKKLFLTPRLILLPRRVFYEFSVKKCCPLLTTLLSGSHIIQNGKLVGAVTHVLVANPTEGYGIFILFASFAALRRRFALCSVFGALAEQSALAR